MKLLLKSVIPLVVLSVLVLLCELTQATPLDDYVNQPDPYTGYKLLKTYEFEAYTGYILNFTSQKWYDESVSDKPVWWHFLCIAIPKVLKRADMGFLLLTGGSNHPEYNHAFQKSPRKYEF